MDRIDILLILMVIYLIKFLLNLVVNLIQTKKTKGSAFVMTYNFAKKIFQKSLTHQFPPFSVWYGFSIWNFFEVKKFQFLK